MKNLRNALLLKQLIQLKQLGYRYTSVTPYTEEEHALSLPNTLESLKKQAMECHLCELSKSRHKVVFGEGNPQAEIMFIGEGLVHLKTVQENLLWDVLVNFSQR